MMRSEALMLLAVVPVIVRSCSLRLSKKYLVPVQKICDLSSSGDRGSRAKLEMWHKYQKAYGNEFNQEDVLDKQFREFFENNGLTPSDKSNLEETMFTQHFWIHDANSHNKVLCAWRILVDLDTSGDVSSLCIEDVVTIEQARSGAYGCSLAQHIFTEVKRRFSGKKMFVMSLAGAVTYWRDKCGFIEEMSREFKKKWGLFSDDTVWRLPDKSSRLIVGKKSFPIETLGENNPKELLYGYEDADNKYIKFSPQDLSIDSTTGKILPLKRGIPSRKKSKARSPVPHVFVPNTVLSLGLIATVGVAYCRYRYALH